MNNLYVIGVLGKLMTAYAATMLLPLLFAWYTNDGAAAGFAYAALVTLAAGLFGIWRGNVKNNSLKAREGYIIMMAVWLLASFFGALPFVFTGALPSYVDAAFETISSLTTTGASVVNNWDALPDSIILWRSLMHWLGGMGIVVLFVAVLPGLGINAFNLLKMELAGGAPEKLAPRIKDTALRLWTIYAVFTFTEMFLLYLAGMTPFDAVVHAISTTATCGFSHHSSSIAYYDNTAIELILFFSMVLAGGNYALYAHAWHRGWRQIFKNTEFKIYLSFIAITALLVAINLYFIAKVPAAQALLDSFFQIASFTTTTAFTTENIDLWPPFSRKILFFLLFVGACAGSTSGGIKFSRFIILFKASWVWLKKMLHPRMVTSVHLDKKPVDNATVVSVLQFFFLYMVTFVAATLLISFTAPLHPFETLGLAAASLGNVGVGFGVIGPASSYAVLPNTTKIISSICMLLGRLELVPVLIFLMPEFWRRQRGW
ncbi:MAG: TrkH family potassium uptake protein [Sporomusaceae bacterium]|jgi:trk system potassium uptake protein TrkH|nr:TrkH family potassium uptake protein [Sporomusaceae bacterium]